MEKELEVKIRGHEKQVEITDAVDEFLNEVERLNRAEATQQKYILTLNRLSVWCRAQRPAILCLSDLDVPRLRPWIHSWEGAPTSRHNQHQRVIAFFNFCREQGWIKENPAKRIKKVPRQQEETLPFSREQYVKGGVYSSNYVYESVRGWKAFEPALTRAESMDAESIWHCAADIPQEWYEEDRASLERLVEELSKRREIIRKLIGDFRKSNRNPFFNWRDSSCITVPCIARRDEAVEIR